MIKIIIITLLLLVTFDVYGNDSKPYNNNNNKTTKKKSKSKELLELNEFMVYELNNMRIPLNTLKITRGRISGVGSTKSISLYSDTLVSNDSYVGLNKFEQRADNLTVEFSVNNLDRSVFYSNNSKLLIFLKGTLLIDLDQELLDIVSKNSVTQLLLFQGKLRYMDNCNEFESIQVLNDIGRYLASYNNQTGTILITNTNVPEPNYILFPLSFLFLSIFRRRNTSRKT